MRFLTEGCFFLNCDNKNIKEKERNKRIEISFAIIRMRI